MVVITLTHTVLGSSPDVAYVRMLAGLIECSLCYMFSALVLRSSTHLGISTFTSFLLYKMA